MSDPLKDALLRRLADEHASLPTSALGRLGRTAGALLRGGRIATKHVGDVDALAGLVASVGELKGIAMKAGQILGYMDVALPEELRAALSLLQTRSQPMPFARVRAIVEAELGPRAHELALEPEPIAAASIGQVHRARVPDGTQVAVKVQYPEIDRAIEADFGPAMAGTRFASLLYPGAKVDALVREAKQRFQEETDYRHEARSQARFAALFAEHPVLRIPSVHEFFTTRRVLVTRYVEGTGLETFLAGNPPAELRDRLGAALFEFYVGALFRHGLYNCDPHPGNYLFLPDGTVAMLDYGCTRAFELAFVDKLARLTQAVHADTRDALHASFVELGMVAPGKRYDFDTARDLVRAFYGPMLRDATQAIDLGEARGMRQVLESKKELMKLALPGEFLFLLRIRYGLMSVLARLGARANWYRLEESWIQERNRPAPTRAAGR